MKVNDFLSLPVTTIARLTGIDKGNWSKFLAGQPISERTLNKAAAKLKLPPDRLLKAINIRRSKHKSCENPQQML